MGNVEDPIYAVNPGGSSQLLPYSQQFFDTITQSIDAAKDILTGLNSNPIVNGIFNIAFGEDYQKDLASQILQNLGTNDFTNAPVVKLVSSQSFNGAYAKETNTIYLSQEFVAANYNNVGAVTGVLLEEFGHYIDDQINVVDAAGDEGDIFSRLVRGQSISDGELVLLNGEDDHGVFVDDGVSVGIEKNVSQTLTVKTDFNGDGKTDILWRNQGGQVQTWLMNGTQVISGVNLQSPGLDWQIQGTGDFNQDGKTDILWRNQGGQVQTWLMNGTQVISGVNLQSPGLDWQIQGTGDFNQDGKTDILWRNQGGQVQTWLMNGTQVISGVNLQSPGLDWQIQGNGSSVPINNPVTTVQPPSGLMTTSTNLTKLINGDLSLIGQKKDVDGNYNYQCWDFVAYATGINGSSSYWNTNNWKAGENVMSNGKIAVGTAIATFLGPNGSYNDPYLRQHTAIFAGYGSENGVDGFYVWDQNWNLNGNLAIKKHFVANNKSGTSDADNYYLIRV